MRKPRYQQKKNHFKLIAFLFLLFSISGALLYWLFLSSFFYIKFIEIRSNQDFKYCDKEKLEKAFFIFNENIFLASLNEIKKNVLNEYPGIYDIEYYKKIPDKIFVQVEEREKIALWCKQEVEEFKQEKNEQATSSEDLIITKKRVGQCFYLDKYGVIFRKSPLIKGDLSLNIYDSSNKQAKIGDKVASEDAIGFILDLKQGLSDFDVDYAEIISPEDIRITLENSYQIYFSPAYSADNQIKALELVLNEEIKENYSSLEYIDLRTKGRVYYK